MKKIIYTLLSLIVIVTVAVIILFDSIGKKISQQYATELLKTPVKISQFSSDFSKKSINIDFIEVKNPPNFNKKNALSLDHFSLKVGDINDDFIIIDELVFDGLEFILDQNASNVNLSQFIDNLNQVQSKFSSTFSSNSSSTNTEHIKIKRFKVSNISLKVNTKWLETVLKVPNISINNFGGNSGIKIDEIGKEVAKEILHNLEKALEEKAKDLFKSFEF